MKTLEELKSMTTEDIARYALQLQEQLEQKQQEKIAEQEKTIKQMETTNYWYNNYLKLEGRFKALVDTLRNIATVSEINN